jgi:hypothetical protein
VSHTVTVTGTDTVTDMGTDMGTDTDLHDPKRPHRSPIPPLFGHNGPRRWRHG